MPTIQFRSTDANFMATLADDLNHDLQQAGIADDLQLSESGSAPAPGQEIYKSPDPISWTTILLAAAGAGGALSVLLSKDGFLSSLARVLEKYVEGRQAEVIIETDEGKKIQVSGPVGEIKALLKQIQS